MYEQVKIVLNKTTHPGNIGAVARAMKNMGFKHLSLVSPKFFPSEEAVARASGAEEILEKAEIVNSLEEALKDCHIVFGLSARVRSRSLSLLGPKEATQELVDTLKVSSKQKAALVFGQEQSGLSNEEILKCQKQISIPTNPLFSSLNIAQAVQIITYELRLAIEAYFAISSLNEEKEHMKNKINLVTAGATEEFYQQLEAILIKIQFLDPKAPGQMMDHLRCLFSRNILNQTELNILLGAIRAADNVIG